MRKGKIVGIVALACGALIWVGSTFNVPILTGALSKVLGGNGETIQKLEKASRLLQDSGLRDLISRTTGVNLSYSDIDSIASTLGMAKNAAGEFNYDDVQDKLKGISKEDIMKLLSKDDPSTDVSNKDSGIPKYDGRYNVRLGKSKFKSLPTKTKYYKLDKYGRPTGAETVITVKSFPKESRKERPIDIDPVGWPKNFKVTVTHKDGSTYKGYFWNRSHIIADSFSGEVRIENLTTGTRAQNVGGRSNEGGMALGESIVRKYLKAKKSGKVYYKVKVHYANDNDLISDYSTVDIKSEDGKEDHHIIVYNEMADYKINRKTGEVSK